jgi:hypothetical protein
MDESYLDLERREVSGAISTKDVRGTGGREGTSAAKSMVFDHDSTEFLWMVCTKWWIASRATLDHGVRFKHQWNVSLRAIRMCIA